MGREGSRAGPVGPSGFLCNQRDVCHWDEAIKTGQMDVANQVPNQLRQRVERAADEDHVLSGKVMMNQLFAVRLVAGGRVDEGLALLREAASLEDAVPYQYGPPFPVKPAREWFGDVLLSLGKRNAAQRQLTLALERTPQRALSLTGLRKTRDHE